MARQAPTKLSDTEIQAALAKIPAWRVEDGKLHREYKFVNFVGAFSFMTSVALIAQELDHHPEWYNVWNTVRVDLTTHDAGGITSLDAKLAFAMEEMAERQLAKAAVVSAPMQR
jgi:4a-hydroxytetrahydrobiopterin dehydratase